MNRRKLRVNSGLYVYDMGVNSMKDVPNSPAISGDSRGLKHADVQPSRYYISIGQVSATFSIARFLGPQVQNFNVVQISDLSSEQIGWITM